MHDLEKFKMCHAYKNETMQIKISLDNEFISSKFRAIHKTNRMQISNRGLKSSFKYIVISQTNLSKNSNNLFTENLIIMWKNSADEIRHRNKYLV